MTDSTYTDCRDHLVDELARVDVLLRIHLTEWRARGVTPDDGPPGMYVSDDQVARLLQPGAPTSAADTSQLRSFAAELRTGIDERCSAAGVDLRLETLAERFGLSRRELDAFLLTLAPEIDLKYEQVFAYLQDDLTRKRPTVGLVLRVLTDGEVERIGARSLFASSSPLVSNGLVTLSPPSDESPLLANLVSADQRIVDFVLGGDDVDPAVDDVVTATEPTATPTDLPIDDDERKRIERLALGADADPVFRYVHGPYGNGKGSAVEAMCPADVHWLVRVDLSEVDAGDRRRTIDRVIREARLRDAPIHVAGVGTPDEGDRVRLRSLVRDLDEYGGHVFLTGEAEWPIRHGTDGHEFLSIYLPRPGYERREALWRTRAVPSDVDPADLAAKFRLTEGQMDDALATARASANGDEPSAGAVYRGCRTQSRRTLGTLARKAEPGHDWDDIVLPDAQRRQLVEVAAHVKHRGTVYGEWGFEDRFSYGTGLNVLFTGPPGTGKTMAAEIIANDADLDMFTIDLASVVSKYVGETEENLRRIFDEAEHTDAILFFDEADALFGKRSEIHDSHDRYANVEVSYLLQRMEAHDGTVILASNFKDNIDDAFLRRITVNVEFPRPERESRVAIWETIFPEETPVEELDVGFLSTFELSGGNVKNVALTASFLAADDGEPVGMAHVVRALSRELQKTGRLVDPEQFGPYQDRLP